MRSWADVDLDQGLFRIRSTRTRPRCPTAIGDVCLSVGKMQFCVMAHPLLCCSGRSASRAPGPRAASGRQPWPVASPSGDLLLKTVRRLGRARMSPLWWVRVLGCIGVADCYPHQSGWMSAIFMRLPMTWLALIRT
jgi:hypothetical protein